MNSPGFPLVCCLSPVGQDRYFGLPLQSIFAISCCQEVMHDFVPLVQMSHKKGPPMTSVLSRFQPITELVKNIKTWPIFVKWRHRKWGIPVKMAFPRSGFMQSKVTFSRITSLLRSQNPQKCLKDRIFKRSICTKRDLDASVGKCATIHPKSWRPGSRTCHHAHMPPCQSRCNLCPSLIQL